MDSFSTSRKFGEEESRGSTAKSAKSVKVVAVGHKEHNELFIRGKKVKL